MNGMNEWIWNGTRRPHRISFQFSDVCRFDITLVDEYMVTMNRKLCNFSHRTWKIENSVKMNTKQILYGRYLTKVKKKTKIEAHFNNQRRELNRSVSLYSPFNIQQNSLDSWFGNSFVNFYVIVLNCSQFCLLCWYFVIFTFRTRIVSSYNHIQYRQPIGISLIRFFYSLVAFFICYWFRREKKWSGWLRCPSVVCWISIWRYCI